MEKTSYSKNYEINSDIELRTDNAISYLSLLDSNINDIKSMLDQSDHKLAELIKNTDIESSRISSIKTMLLTIKRSLLTESFI